MSESSSALLKRYHSQRIFRIYPFLFLLATIWLGSETWKQRSIIWLIMFVGVGFITIRLILGAWAWAEFDGRVFVYHTPLRRQHRVHVRQLARVEMGGRRNKALIIGYHPYASADIIDPHSVKYINCVPLEDQEELYERLRHSLAL